MTCRFLLAPNLYRLQFHRRYAASCLEIAAETDSRDPPRSPATKRMARVFAQREKDKDKPILILSWALACSDAALKIYWEDDCDKKHIKQARGLFRGALSRGADQRTIFLVWTGMELRHRDTAAARACFEEWRSRGGGCVGDADLWCHYASFEFQHGTAARAGAVAEAALAACPRDPVVFALYANLELRMGCDGRARHIFSADEDAVKCVTNDVEQYRNYLREAAARPMIGDLFFFFCGRGGSA